MLQMSRRMFMRSISVDSAVSLGVIAGACVLRDKVLCAVGIKTCRDTGLYRLKCQASA